MARHPVDGQPLDTLVTGKPDPARSTTFLMHYPHSPHRSDYFTVYRSGDWKVIYHYFPSKASDNSHYQLYNLAEDRFEVVNRARQEPELLASMVAKLESIAESVRSDPLRPDWVQTNREGLD